MMPMVRGEKMTTKQQQQLARIYNRRTAYELVASNGDRKILVGYTVGKARRDILSMAAKNGERWVALTGRQEMTFAKKAGDGAAMGDWTFRYSGRTQRACILEGELTFIADLA
jgi:hypothetical protein